MRRCISNNGRALIEFEYNGSVLSTVQVSSYVLYRSTEILSKTQRVIDSCQQLWFTMTGAITDALLSFIKLTLDDNGAWDWNFRFVGLVAAAVLLAIKMTCHKAYGIDWYSQVNAIVTGLGAVAIVYLDYFASEELTGVPGACSKAYFFEKSETCFFG